MKNAYFSFLQRVGLPEIEDHTDFCASEGLLIHNTHGWRFAAQAKETVGMMLAVVRDPTSFDMLPDYIDESVIPGTLTFHGEAPEKPTSVVTQFAAAGDCSVFSAVVIRNGITVRQTVFTLDGGIAVLGCGICSAHDCDDPMPIYETGVMRCFSDPEKMKIHKNTTTHGGLIIRTLMDDIKPVRSIRPCRSDEQRETRNVFTMSLQTTPAMPCYAYEITTVGMGYGSQIMANSPVCQAIMLDGGEIINFSPENGTVSLF